MNAYAPFTDAHSSEGHSVHWSTWAGDGHEHTSIRWENEGFTVSGTLSDNPQREHIQYVLRLSATWQARQFILFRDLEEPDLWLATDGTGRWGEMNGARRTELDDCYDIDMACTPFTQTLPIRRVPLLDGDSTDLAVIVVDPDTLGARSVRQRYTRLSQHQWRLEQDDSNDVTFTVDEFGLVVDFPELFRRVD